MSGSSVPVAGMVTTLDKPIVCPVLVGREEQIAALARCLDEARDGAGQVVLITGEAGIGKSRLVAEATARAGAAGLTVLIGHCFEPDRSVPYAPLVDLLRSCCAARSAGEIATAVASVPELAVLLPELTEFLPDAPAGTVMDKHRLFLALRLAVTRCTAGAPALLVIEDAHWSDETSLEWLLGLARQIAEQPWLLLITYRVDEVSPALAHVVAELDRGRLAAELRLARLTPGEVAAMLRASLDLQDHALFAPNPLGRVDFANTIHTRTEGNPFFVEEVLRSLVAAGEICRTEHGWVRGAVDDARTPLPRTVEDAVQRRLERLGDGARRTLTLAAVAGQRVEFALLLDLCDCDEATLLGQLKELIAAGLIVEEAGDRFAFRHALTRQAVEAGLLDRERRSLHRTIAEALERLHGEPDVVDDLARHCFEAREWEKTLTYARRAGERAYAMYAPDAASAHISRAVQAAEALTLPPDSGLLRLRGQVYDTLGQFDLANQAYQAALHAAEARGDRHAEWQALIDLGFLWTGSDYVSAEPYFRRALDLARTDGDSALVAHSLNRVGNWHLNVGRPRDALANHGEALAIFEDGDDRAGVAETLDLLGLASAMAGDVKAAVSYMHRAIARFRELDDRRGLVSCLATLSAAGSIDTGGVLVPVVASQDEARHNGQEALRIAREIGWRAGAAYALCAYGGWFQGGQGAYADALMMGREALNLTMEIGHRQWRCFAHCALGTIHARLFVGPTARRHFEEALQIAQEIGSIYWTLVVTGMMTPALILERDFVRARAVLDAALADKPPPEGLAPRCAWYGRAELALAEGDAVAALAIADDLTARTINFTAERPAPLVAELRGRALMANGRWTEADAEFRAAMTVVEEQGGRPMQWRILASLGRIAQAEGRRDEAERAFGAARDIIAELAAELPNDELRQTFVDGAARLVPSAPAPSARNVAREAYGGLTEREREVAALLTAGKSNREIGDALFVSEWTVATHVRNILAKLDFSSRSQIAAWARDHGLGESA